MDWESSNWRWEGVIGGGQLDGGLNGGNWRKGGRWRLDGGKWRGATGGGELDGGKWREQLERAIGGGGGLNGEGNWMEANGQGQLLYYD